MVPSHIVSGGKYAYAKQIISRAAEAANLEHSLVIRRLQSGPLDVCAEGVCCICVCVCMFVVLKKQVCMKTEHRGDGSEADGGSGGEHGNSSSLQGKSFCSVPSTSR